MKHDLCDYCSCYYSKLRKFDDFTKNKIEVKFMLQVTRSADTYIVMAHEF